MIHNIVSPRFRFFVALCCASFATAGFQSTFGATIHLDFTSTGGTVLDSTSQGTGFSSRLSGTTTTSPDPRLILNTAGTGTLIISGSAIGTDFNGQGNVGSIEAPGVQLSSLGFTGTQDFSITATFTNVSADVFNDFSQFGLYVGTSASNLTREGFVYGSVLGGSNFYGNNNTGLDSGTTFSAQPGFSTGDTLTATISRAGGVFTETVNGFDVTPTIDPNTLFTGATDLTVGVYSINTDGSHPFDSTLESFSATVETVPEPGTWALMLGGLTSLAAIRRMRVRGA